MPNFWLKNKYNTMHTLSKARKKSRLIFSYNINLVSFNFCNGLGDPDGLALIIRVQYVVIRY